MPGREPTCVTDRSWRLRCWRMEAGVWAGELLWKLLLRLLLRRWSAGRLPGHISEVWLWTITQLSPTLFRTSVVCPRAVNGRPLYIPSNCPLVGSPGNVPVNENEGVAANQLHSLESGFLLLVKAPRNYSSRPRRLVAAADEGGVVGHNTCASLRHCPPGTRRAFRRWRGRSARRWMLGRAGSPWAEAFLIDPVFSFFAGPPCRMPGPISKMPGSSHTRCRPMRFCVFVIRSLRF